MRGTFYGIGVGPGDSELLTLKAVKILRNIDVVIAPKTEKNEGSIALDIVRPHLKEAVEICYQVFPMVKDFQKDFSLWEQNKIEIEAILDAGKNAAFLTLGDPMFYSTYIYIFKLLQKDGVKIETVPGIPAFVAIAAKYNQPIVEGNDILSIIPATANTSEIEAALTHSDAAVLMKVYKNLNDIKQTLETCGYGDTLTVSRLGFDDEEKIDLKTFDGTDLNYLSTILARRK
ncbi:MAG: precorrin-2 C(20)-methyltransferase [Selenomonadaceae bacterium]|nr:precorrin-2 C(20)-methyltransferase [Selenomonadaceae bacterium]